MARPAALIEPSSSIVSRSRTFPGPRRAVPPRSSRRNSFVTTASSPPLYGLVLERFAERDRMRHRLVQLIAVELAFPPADHDGGDAVADQVGECPAFAHELVDADEDGEGLDGDVGNDGEGRGQRDESRAGDARGAFRGDHGDHEDAELLA